MRQLPIILASLSLACAAGAAAAQTGAQTDVQARLDAFVHGVPRERAALTDCLREHVVTLGRGNTETADTLLRAARSLCSDHLDALQHDYEAGYPTRYELARAMRQDQETAENAAVAALLEARQAGR